MATTAVPSGGRTDGVNLKNDTDPACKSLRKVLQQNSKESNQCQKQQRYLDRQKRSVHAKLDREEKELRDQLRRLQDEKRMLDLCDERADVTVMVPPDDTSREEEAVVNPYPVCFRARKISAPSKAGWSHDHTEEGVRPASRAISCHNMNDAESLDQCLPATLSSACLGSLPPLHCSSRLSHSPGSPGWEGPGMFLGPEEGEHWIGDPEAITSIRRPRKSIAQQRQQHMWSRSSSLKEARSSNSSKNKGRLSSSSLMSRSSSMRERYPRGEHSPHDTSPISLSRSNSTMLSPCDSFKRSGTLLQSMESLTDSVHGLDVSHGHRSFRARNLKGSDQESNPSTPESPNIVSEEIYQLRQKGSDVLSINVEASVDLFPPILNAPGTPPSPLSLKPPTSGKTRSPRGSLKKKTTKPSECTLDEEKCTVITVKTVG